jgi:3-oxoacyl-[acyl-carrier protein] reductase
VRTALVTGASRGIGRGIALDLARSGHGLTITSRKQDDLDALVPELVAAGAGEVVPVAADMADRDALPGLVAAHRAAFGGMHALVLNAGVGTAGSIATFDIGRVDKTLAVNFTAALVLVQQALPSLRAGAADDPGRGAKIIALSSITGAYAEPGLAVYGASKAALLSLIETLNREESANGVVATALAPAFVDTDMAAWVSERIPPASMIPVDDVVQVVRMLLTLTTNTVVSRMVIARAGTSGHHA